MVAEAVVAAVVAEADAVVAEAEADAAVVAVVDKSTSVVITLRVHFKRKKTHSGHRPPVCLC